MYRVTTRNLASVWKRYPLICWIALFLLIAPAASAQIAGTGNIQGVVEDPNGAVVPNAVVKVLDVSTGVKHTTKSDASGLYVFPGLRTGTYDLSVEAPGFKTYEQAGIVLEVGSSIGINVKLSIGEATTVVAVHSEGLALQTEDASFKQTIDKKTLTELPLNGRQVTSLITLAGATVPSTAATTGNKGFWSSVSPDVAGGQGNETDYRLDGGDNNDYMTNTSFAFPFPDAVSQFSVETTGLSAQTGLHPGGLVNAVTRSGTNEWHGTEFEFIRNNFIDATNFFSSTKDSLHQNQYGGTLGGKIIKDRLFFFAGYQRLSSSQSSSSSQAQVPTQANLNGDFSVTDGPTCTTSGKAVQLLNPITGEALPNDQIPTSYYNSSALALDKYLPATTNPCGIVFYAIPVLQGENQFITRIDSVLSKTNTLYGRYFLDGYKTPAFFSPNNILLTENPGNTEREQSLTIGDTWVPTAKFVNALHLTATRRTNDRGPASTGINAATIGVDAYQPYSIGLRVSAGKFTTYCSTCALGVFNVNSFSVIDDANMLIGKHQLVFGGELVRAELNINNAYSSNGIFTFTGIYSEKGPAGTSPGGTGEDADLDFLTGSMTSFAQSKPQQNALRAPIPSLYVQDTYHLNNRTVITDGLRWGAEIPAQDYFGRGSTFSMSSFLDNQHSTVFPNAPAGSFYYGDAGVSKSFTQNHWAQFSPRVGITFDPKGNGKTVFRAGGAIVYDELNFFASAEVNYNPPFATEVMNDAASSPVSFSSPWSSGTAPGNPFPEPFRPLASTVFPLSAQYIVYGPHYQSPYVAQWTASMQQELPHGWQMQLDYLGNKTTHAAYGYPLNPDVYIPGTWTGTGSCGAMTTSPGIGQPCSSTGNDGSRFALTLDSPAQGVYYSGGGGGTVEMVSGGNASYNGLVATIQHRASNSFTVLANYTWSHCIDLLDNGGELNSTSLEDPHDPHMDYASCGFDLRNMVNAALVVTSHVAWPGWKTLLSSWELAPILRATSGAPFNVTSGIDNSLTDVNNDRPNLIGPRPYTHSSPTQDNVDNSSVYLNASAFSENATGTYGNLGRNAFVGPKYVDVDAALSRFFPLRERLNLQFRLEAYNVLNHPNFNNPGTTALNSPNFGKITSSAAARIFQGAVKLNF